MNIIMVTILTLTQALKKLKTLSHQFPVFKPRHTLLHAFWKYSQRKVERARKLGNKAIKQAYSYGCKFDEEWTEACMMAWYGNKQQDIIASGDAGMFILR